MVAPLSLCVIRCFFHLCDFRFHGFYQLCELFFAFLSCLGIDILGDAFAVNSRREPTFVEMVVYHRHTSRAGLTDLGLVWLKNRFCGVFVACLVLISWEAAVRAFLRLYRRFLGRCEPPLAVA